MGGDILEYEPRKPLENEENLEKPLLETADNGHRGRRGGQYS
jgi:hypothetical protein